MSDSKDIVAIIPEFYFDIISRIPAGMVLISLVSFSALSQSDIIELKEWLFGGDVEGFPFTIIFILFFCSSYAISIPLTLIGGLAHIFYRPIVCKIIKKSYSAEVLLLEKRYDSIAENSRFTHLLNDELEQRNNHALSILPKMRAEVSLCDNLTAAFVVSVIIFLFSNISPKVTLFILSFASFSFVGGAYRFHHLMVRQISYARIVGIITCLHVTHGGKA